jgi:hypothetical protein
MRLIEPGKPDVWLMVRGERRRVASSAVYDSFWSETSGLVPFDGVEWITLGPELGEGSCLVRADETLSIYLVARTDSGAVLRHFIPTYESLLDYGFDEVKVRNIPPLVLEGLMEGMELTSAADRATRG